MLFVVRILDVAGYKLRIPVAPEQNPVEWDFDGGNLLARLISRYRIEKVQVS